MKNKSAIKSALSVLLKLSGAGLAFVFYAMIGRVLSMADAGVLFFGIAFCLVASGVARFGLDHALLRFVSQRDIGGDLTALKVAIYQSLMLVVVCSSLIVGGVILFIDFFLQVANLPPQSVLVVSIIVVSVVPTALYMAIVAVLNGLERNVLASFLQTGAFQFVVVFVSFVLLYLSSDEDKGVVFAVAYVVSSFVVAVVSLFLCWKHLGGVAIELLFKSWNFTLVRSALSLFPGSIADIAINMLPAVLVGSVSSPVEVARFSVPQRVAGVVYFVFASVNTVFGPQIGRAVKDGNGLKELYFRAVRMMSIAIVPVALVLMALGGPVLSLFGRDYGNGYWPLVLLLAAQVVHALFGPVLTVLVMSGRRREYSIAMFSGAAVTSICVFFLGSVYGAMGAAWGVLLGVMSQKVMGFIFSRPMLLQSR